jgi:hypothetical protein
MHAVIEWISKERGGRREPPSGVAPTPYTTLVRFVDEPWPAHDAWSLMVKKERDWGRPDRWLAEVGFLVDEAPVDSLREGREFELYEGKTCVARGKIVGDAPVWAGSGQDALLA